MRAVRLGLAGLGLLAMGYALVGAVGSADITPDRHVLFLVAVLVAHDGLLLPVFLAAGLLVHRYVPAGVRGIVQAALIGTAAVTLVALPLVIGAGRRPDNPSALPRDYPHGLLVLIAASWLAAAVALALRQARARPGVKPSSGGTGEPLAGPHPAEAPLTDSDG